MFRKFLLFLLRVTDSNKNKQENMTDSPKFAEMPAQPMYLNAWHSSPILGQLSHLNDVMVNAQYKLTTIEQAAMDGVIKEYTTRYTSALAKAISEGN